MSKATYFTFHCATIPQSSAVWSAQPDNLELYSDWQDMEFCDIVSDACLHIDFTENQDGDARCLGCGLVVEGAAR